MTLTDEDRALIARLVKPYTAMHAMVVNHPEEVAALLAAARQARTQGPGEGWVLVPRVPTVEMLVAATEEWLCVRSQEDRAEFIWDAMLAAAPRLSDQGGRTLRPW